MQRKDKYQLYGLVFQLVCLAANITAVMFLAVLLIRIAEQGLGTINLNFLSGFPAPRANQAGILPALVGTAMLMVFTTLAAVPMSLGAAIYLEEYARNSRIVRFIKLNIQNLAGVPSVVYGILGLTIFARGASLGNSVLAASLTMALLILPIITIAAQEALRAVPESFRLAGYAVGMTRWQVVRHQVLPLAVPGMMTGMILALSRAIGESAPLIMVGAVAFIPFLPTNPLDKFTALPILIYDWTDRPEAAFREIAASGIIILLGVLLLMNAAAIYMRLHYKKKFKNIYA